MASGTGEATAVEKRATMGRHGAIGREKCATVGRHRAIGRRQPDHTRTVEGSDSRDAGPVERLQLGDTESV